MATTLEYALKVDSAGVESGAAAVDNLGNKLTDTKTASEGLAKSLEKQEARIKIIDGAINLLGGSVELAAGAFVGLGLASEEQAEQFQTAALGAIAFADGAKRSFDGIKSLTEGLKSYGGIAGAARKAQLAINAAILANPYIAAAAALAIVTAGLYLFVTSANSAEKAQAALNAESVKASQADSKYANLQLRILKARGASEVAIKKEEIRVRELDIATLILSANNEKDAKKRIELDKQRKVLQDDNKVAAVDLTRLETEATEKAAENRAKDLQDGKDKQKSKNELAQQAKDKKAADDLKAKEDQKKVDDDKFQAEQDYLDKVNDLLMSEESKRILSVAKTYDDLIEQARNFGRDTTELEAARGVAIQEVIDTQAAERTTKQDEANAKEVADAKTKEDALQAVRDFNLANASQAIAALGSLFEEGTAASKAAAIAEIAIRTGEGFVNGLGIAQKTALAAPLGSGAFIFPLFYAAQIASVLAAANQARKILGAGPSVQKPNVPAAPSIGGGGAFTGNLPGTGPTPTTPVTQEPIRAYVVARDVSTGQEANAAIRRRRRLGGG